MYYITICNNKMKRLIVEMRQCKPRQIINSTDVDGELGMHRLTLIRANGKQSQVSVATGRTPSGLAYSQQRARQSIWWWEWQGD